MIRVIAVDDEPLALGQIKKYISKVPFLELVATCDSAMAARKCIEENKVDAIFLDINMPDVSGLEFLRALRNPPMAVLTTAYSEYAVEGFKVDAVDYLLKPFTLSEFISSAEKLKTRFEMRTLALNDTDRTGCTTSSQSGSSGGFVFFKADYKIIKVEIADIEYVEGMSEYLKIYLKREQTPKVVLMSFQKLMEKLPASLFVRVHRSYVVNLARISEVGAGVVQMESGKTIPIGDSYRAALLKVL